MVLKSDAVTAGVQRFVEPLTLNASPDEATLVFSIYETIVIDTTTWESATLEPWDLAVLSGCGARLSRLEPVDSADAETTVAPAYVFIATLSAPDDGAMAGQATAS
jgi:hypothetical protein